MNSTNFFATNLFIGLILHELGEKNLELYAVRVPPCDLIKVSLVQRKFLHPHQF